MKKVLQYSVIDYNMCDCFYIEKEKWTQYLDKEMEKIVSFFAFCNWNTKILIRFWPSIEKFRTVFSLENKNTIGLIQKSKEEYSIEIVSYKELAKTCHRKYTIKKYLQVILHEFVHVCHKKYTLEKSYVWLF